MIGTVPLLVPQLALLALAAQAPGSFEKLASQATAAREQNRLAEAAELYRDALRVRPEWKEGLWYLGTVLYEQERCGEARPVLAQYTKLEPKSGPGWTLLGLCTFQAREYESALGHLRHGAALGLGGNVQMQRVSQYHQVLLLNVLGQHESAWPIVRVLARDAEEGPELITAAGLAVLRMRMLPSDVPGDKRPVVLSAGRAMWLSARRMPAEAQRAFEDLVKTYPDEPNVHYAYGSFLLGEHPDDAMRELRRELEISPDHVPALVSLAFEHLKRKEPAAALPYAGRAAAVAPADFATRAALGRALVESGDVAAGAKELEAAAKLAPDSPQVRFALAGAYRKLGRRQDAEREQAEFLRLQKK